MKALSLWQPWATLMAIGAKRNETRSWETLYRGPLAIHAAKTWDRHLIDVCRVEPYATRLWGLRPNEGGAGAWSFETLLTQVLPRGVIVAVVDLVDCQRISAANTPKDHEEEAFGDYTPGRFMWQLENPRMLKTPIPYRGAQGLFTVPDEVVEAQL